MSGKMGAPSKFTEAVRNKILDAIRKGNYREVSAKYAGITAKTLREWMARGVREKEGPYADFCAAVLEAETEAEISVVAKVVASPDLVHLRWWLERKFRERWGPDKDIIRDIIKRINTLEENRAAAKADAPA